MSVIVPITLLERRDTTEAWEYVNPILANKEAGFETDSYGLPVGMKMGDGVNHWDDLPYWFTATLPPPPAPTTIVAGLTVTPLTVAYAGNASTGYVLRNTDTNLIDNNTNVFYDLATFTIVGADDGTGKFADNLIFGIRP